MWIFLAASALLGVGIAIDVALATFAMQNRLQVKRQKYIWILGVTFTHTAFPMIGYYGFAYIYKVFPYFHILIGLMSACLIVIFLARQLLGWVREQGADCADEAVSLSAIVAVSWDALWSGPAKSSQAIGWSALEIFLSFLIAGAIVGIVALVVVWLISGSRAEDGVRLSPSIPQRLFFMWAEFSVIGYFGVLALMRYVVGSTIAWPAILAASLAGGAAILYPFKTTIERNLRPHG
jgi:hypothetical protein